MQVPAARKNTEDGTKSYKKLSLHSSSLFYSIPKCCLLKKKKSYFFTKLSGFQKFYTNFTFENKSDKG